ncbi:MAG TPA: hybrid sensor histidine kinase/response regulator [Candidatus Acidoferrales bacterium]|nr:hybrid sensor histidine kinase/response regulator [Candidatus Acidoferrales bacterium]
MTEREKEFLNKLIATFKVEAEEHLKLITAGLLELEKRPADDRQLVEDIFREAHSLKGAARAVSMAEIETLCQSLENVFAAWKQRALSPSAELFDLLYRSLDTLRRLLATPEGEPSGESLNLSGLLRDLDSASKGTASRNPLPVEDPKAEPERRPAVIERAPAEMHSSPADTVRISTGKLDAVLLKAEELLSAKLAAGQHAADLSEVNAALTAWKAEWAKIQPLAGALRRSLEKNGERRALANGQLAKIIDFLDWNQRAFTDLESKLSSLLRAAEQDHRAVGAMVDDLLSDTKKLLMLPFSSILDPLPGLVRGLARDQGKEIDLEIEGAELEVDRRILEEMKDPLIHLVRNSADHGVEKPLEREQKGKPRRGTIKIAIAQKDSNRAEIVVSDDGRGIDLAKVRASALKLGLIAPAEAQSLGEAEVLALVFRSGVSTSPLITDISGRGLGLAIVREKAEKLSGAVAIESRPGFGTSFRVAVPLTMATFRGVPVRVNGNIFVLPSAQVERAARVEKRNIKTVENKETAEIDGEAVSLVHLADVLELPRKSPNEDSNGSAQVVVTGLGGKRIAFIVDEILGEQEVLVKSLGRQLSRVRNIAGATVLATRKLVPVLNVSDLVASAAATSAVASAPAEAASDKARKTRVLVVEDSITARSLLKSILEAAGYDVQTAVDGIDAFTQLRSAEFDVVVSDVEMPRMNGFDLTAKIRADKKLAELPVILVTALESREDKEKGIDVGANAYIVKSSFDQSNLLEVIKRLA